MPETKHSDTHIWLRRHIILALSLGGLLSLALIAGTIYYQYRSVISEKATGRLVSIVLEHKGTIESYLLKITTALHMVNLLQPLEQLSDQKHLSEIFEDLGTAYDYAFEDLGVIDAQGNHLSYVGPYDLMDKNYSDADWYQKVMEKNVHISNVFLGYRQVPHFIIAVKQGQGDQAWVLRATVNAAKFGELVEFVRFGRTGHAYLVSFDGLFQTRSRSGYRVLDRFENGMLDLEWFEGVRFWEHESEGRRIFRAKTWMKGGEWLLIVEQDVDDVFGELESVKDKALLLFFIGAAVVSLMTLCTMRILIRKVAQADAERNLVDEQLIQSQKLASIGQLSAGIAHEINNPLAVIGEEAGWMQDILKREHFQDIKDLDELRDSLREVVVQAGRCREITHKLLSFARKMESTIKEVDVNKLVNETIEMREREAVLNNIEIVRQFDQDMLVVHSDSSQLRQVLLNLINNAMDAIKKSGTITVSTGKGERGAVWVKVMDTGPGIPRENLARIFDPFFTTKPPGKGTGLGLSICHGILEKLGGKLSVASQVGEGTTFTMHLPLEPKSTEKNNG